MSDRHSPHSMILLQILHPGWSADLILQELNRRITGGSRLNLLQLQLLAEYSLQVR